MKLDSSESEFERTFAVCYNLVATKTIIVRAASKEEALEIIDDGVELEKYENREPSKIRRVEIEEHDEDLIDIESEGLM